MKVVLVSGGNPPSYELISKELSQCEYLISADSGGNCLFKYKIVPNYLMGDFDSIDKSVLDFFIKDETCNVEDFPSDKDFTDTELILSKAIDLGATEVVFLGCTGTRIDHVMGNVGLLLKCLKLGIKAYIKDENNTIEIVNRSTKIKGKKGEYFSLQAYCEIVKNLNIKGARFKLIDYDLRLGDSRTISNEFLDTDVAISFDSGVVLIIYSKD